MLVLSETSFHSWFNAARKFQMLHSFNLFCDINWCAIHSMHSNRKLSINWNILLVAYSVFCFDWNFVYFEPSKPYVVWMVHSVLLLLHLPHSAHKYFLYCLQVCLFDEICRWNLSFQVDKIDFESHLVHQHCARNTYERHQRNSNEYLKLDYWTSSDDYFNIRGQSNIFPCQFYIVKWLIAFIARQWMINYSIVHFQWIGAVMAHIIIYLQFDDMV